MMRGKPTTGGVTTSIRPSWRVAYDGYLYHIRLYEHNFTIRIPISHQSYFGWPYVGTEADWAFCRVTDVTWARPWAKKNFSPWLRLSKNSVLCYTAVLLSPSTRTHLGQNRLYDTMSLHLYHPDLRAAVEDIVCKCETCQKQKHGIRGHGHTAPREASSHPWRTVAVDLIGPWSVPVGGQKIPFMALTVIDQVTNLAELVRLDNKTLAHVAWHFEQCWLARYSKPGHIVFDQGKEFTGYAFQAMLARHQIIPHPISVKNPQANGICERMHQAVGNTLRAACHLNPPAGIYDANQLVDTALANAVFATRASLNSTIRASPGSLAFGRDMILDIPIVADWNFIRQHRQQLIDRRLIDVNKKRFSYAYHPGDEVLKLSYKPNKMQERATGPYRVEAVHTNGTLTIRLNPHTIERISIRRVKPFKR